MGVLLAIDPGKHHAGAALFDERGRLFRVAKLKARSKNPAQACKDLGDEAIRLVGLIPVDKIVCEKPSFWRSGGMRGDPNDILDLMATNGAIFDAVPADEREYVPVTSWKGQVPKPKKGQEYIVERRVRKRLSEPEAALLGEKPDHNVVDAIGIGLWTLQRQ
jgi:hypothetical protein